MNIYIIFNQSYECDGYDSPSNKVIFLSTDKEVALKEFDKLVSSLQKSEKWHYEYELVEYIDGYSYFENNHFTVIKNASNELL